jgi:hypothetical protein
MDEVIAFYANLEARGKGGAMPVSSPSPLPTWFAALVPRFWGRLSRNWKLTWGHTLVLLATGLVLFLLLVASYSQRQTWLALGSAALSIALVFGLVFLSAGQDTGPLRQGLTRLAQELPAGWDRGAIDLAEALDRASEALARARTDAAGREPIQAAAITRWFGWGPMGEPDPADTEDAEAGAEPEPESVLPTGATDAADAAIQWLFREAPPATGEPLILSGVNASDQPLKGVRAVLKPDSGPRELDLKLEVEGGTGGNGTDVPAGTQFILAPPVLTEDEAAGLGGAILSFTYVQAGQRRTSILYLTATMIAALAPGG